MTNSLHHKKDIPEIRALEAAISLVEWALVAKGEGWLPTPYAREMATTIHLLTVCLDEGRPFLGGLKPEADQTFSTGQLCGRKCPVL